MSRFAECLRANTAGFISLSECQVALLEAHWRLLCRWNQKLNLTSITEEEEAVRRHYCESLFVAALLPGGPLKIADIGSGAGFPGFPIAVAREDIEVDLVESNRRKAVFLREAARGLANVRVRGLRAENLEGQYNWLVSRAVKPTFVIRCGERLGCGVALLLSRRDADSLMAADPPKEYKLVPLPWDVGNCVLLAQTVPRGTPESVGTRKAFHVKPNLPSET